MKQIENNDTFSQDFTSDGYPDSLFKRISASEVLIDSQKQIFYESFEAVSCKLTSHSEDTCDE